MGNNEEIRKRMETYRIVLLSINWIASIIGVIVGFVMVSTLARVALIIVVVFILFGIIGHFLINVALAIPFILLNNGDILGQQMKLSSGNSIPNNDPNSYDWICKKCNNTNRKSALFCNSCGEKKSNFNGLN